MQSPVALLSFPKLLQRGHHKGAQEAHLPRPQRRAHQAAAQVGPEELARQRLVQAGLRGGRTQPRQRRGGGGGGEGGGGRDGEQCAEAAGKASSSQRGLREAGWANSEQLMKTLIRVF